MLKEETGNGAEEIEKEHKRLQGILERLRDIYELGDIERDEYLIKRDYYKAQLTALRPAHIPDLEMAAGLFQDFQGNWEAATDEEKKVILHTLLDGVYLDSEKGVTKIVVKAEYRPFFDL
ncbi:MAG: hypothetical protein M5U01_14260 [Ardenticatenaceae bacterium]|nr:hypothetical protein [Ardenticatenaceae bacterium]